MYIETVAKTKKEAIAKAKSGFLFWRDSSGVSRVAEVSKVNSSWGIWEFFTCSHREPKGFQKVGV